MTAATNVRHPGRTPAQRRVLDEIGCGNNSPIAQYATIKALLRAGLIVELPPKILSGRFPVTIRQFEMPIPVHMDWCKAMAEQDDDE